MKLDGHGNNFIDPLLDLALLHMRLCLGDLISGPGKAASSENCQPGFRIKSAQKLIILT